MAGKPLPNFSQFVHDVLLSPYSPPARLRVDAYMDAATRAASPGDRLRFPSPCELEGCQSCTGVGCDCACHTSKKEDEADAETFAYKRFPEGCQCSDNGDVCDWCLAKQDWLL